MKSEETIRKIRDAAWEIANVEMDSGDEKTGLRYTMIAQTLDDILGDADWGLDELK